MRYLVRFSAGLALLTVLLPLPAQAATSKSQDISGAVTQSYSAAADVQIGMIVSLDPKNPKTVVPLKSGNIKQMLGVVVPQRDATIVLTPQSTTTQQVLVAVNGQRELLVSNQGGAIKTGDYVTISSVSGVGMKASEGQSQVLGKAASSFGGNANVVASLKLKDSVGRTNTVAIGRIPVDINIAKNPLASRATDQIPGILSNAAKSVAHKPVSPARVYIALILIIMTTAIAGSVLYSGVRNGMQAVGRNPLAKKSILVSLTQTVIVGLIIFAVGVIAVYLLLKL